ncbi:MAG TPA: hypothetical protein VG406_27525 [Isosphaeraceae bacterium]|jgi:hypothetical protein|nr:hypothetical protein [Isosphaeraceae bacterium]
MIDAEFPDPTEPDPSACKAALAADLVRVAVRDRWGRALMAVGWIHLATFLACQALYTAGDRGPGTFLAIWALEFVAVLWAFRRIAGPSWHRATPLAGVVLRVWATLLILSFNVASLNTLTGWQIDWFKPVWATLSSFAFMVLAYLISYKFFFPAVAMYFTGLLMVRNPDWNYLIYGLSWWANLQVIALILLRRSRSHAAELSSLVGSRAG